jgi:hypothetical protein
MTKTNSECLKCNGTGRLAHFAHVDNGRCFTCGGSGVAQPGAPRAARTPVQSDLLNDIRNTYRAARSWPEANGPWAEYARAGENGESSIRSELAARISMITDASKRAEICTAFSALGLDVAGDVATIRGEV